MSAGEHWKAERPSTRELKHELARKKMRKQAMETMLAKSINRMREAKEAGDTGIERREKINIATVAAFITRINDEIFVIEQRLGMAEEEQE